MIRFINETSHKASHEDDLASFRWLNPHLGQLSLSDINRDVVDKLTHIRQEDGVSNATVNRTLAVVRCVLRKAEREWEWIAKAPYVRMLPEPKRRIRWLTQNEAHLLIEVLPPHLKSLVRFSLATGLRKSNATGLMWNQVDMTRRIAWIHADQAKARRSISVPLNQDALDVIRSQIGKHDEYIFTYQGKPIQQVNTKAWKNALSKTGIQDFRWHDLRHTWASWHVQNGTPLAVLQELGGWESSEMVRKYAHLSHEHSKRRLKYVLDILR